MTEATNPTGEKNLRMRIRQLFTDGSLRGRTLSGGAVLLVGEVYSNVLRLASNLIMTRLLFPEAFGVMLVINLVFSALAMLSDVGIRSAIISKKGEIGENFINVAWTIMIVRGLLLGAIAMAIAHPIEMAYGHPQLFELIMLASLSPIISGFASPFPTIAERNIQFLRVTVLHSLTQTMATAVTLVWLLIIPTIWALAAHGISAAVFAVLFSFILFPYGRVRLAWDHHIVKELYHFGKWVLLGTALTFLGRQGDSLFVSRFLDFETLGVFSIAISFAKLIELFAEKLSWGLLFPVFSEMKTHPLEHFSGRLKKLRLAVYGLCFPIVIILSIAGRDIVELLYDTRYHQAGWMLEVLALGFGFYALASTVNSLPLSHEDSKRHMWMQLLRVLSLLGSMLIGGYFFGIPGLIWGITAGQIVYYPLLQIGVRSYGVRSYGIDLAFAALALLLAGTVWSIRGWPMPTV